MKSGFEEVLELWKDTVHVSRELYLQSSAFLDVLLPETAETLQVHEVNILLRDESVRLCNECLGDDKRIHLIGLSDVVLTHRESLDEVDDADLVAPGHKKFHQVICIVYRRFNTNDEAALLVWCERREQLTEAIIVIRKFERLDKYFTVC